jgi:membrane-associated phospholipid phosphatase
MFPEKVPSSSSLTTPPATSPAISWFQAFGRWPLILSGAIILAFLLFGHHFTYHKEVQFDIDFLERLRQIIPASLGEALRLIYIGTGAEVTACLVVASLGYFLWRRYWVEARCLAFATLGILLVVDQVLKPIFNRRRPLESLVEVDGRSFPSGHSAGSVVFYFYLATIFAAHYPQWRKRIFLGATLWVLMIGLASMYCRVHWPSDIVAGYAVGYVWLSLSLALLRKGKPKTYTDFR